MVRCVSCILLRITDYSVYTAEAGDIQTESATLFKTHVGHRYQAPLYPWRLDVVGCTV